MVKELRSIQDACKQFFLANYQAWWSQVVAPPQNLRSARPEDAAMEVILVGKLKLPQVPTCSESLTFNSRYFWSISELGDVAPWSKWSIVPWGMHESPRMWGPWEMAAMDCSFVRFSVLVSWYAIRISVQSCNLKFSAYVTRYWVIANDCHPIFKTGESDFFPRSLGGSLETHVVVRFFFRITICVLNMFIEVKCDALTDTQRHTHTHTFTCFLHSWATLFVDPTLFWLMPVPLKMWGTGPKTSVWTYAPLWMQWSEKIFLGFQIVDPWPLQCIVNRTIECMETQHDLFVCMYVCISIVVVYGGWCGRPTTHSDILDY